MIETLTDWQWYQHIIADTEGMTQEERRDYYDAHPGSRDIVT